MSPLSLTLPGQSDPVAQYHDGTDLDLDLSPRPYLHPVRTPAGHCLTEIWPQDHRHHYGVSNAIVDIDAVTYWGGKSYVDGSGYVMLPNQGRQLGQHPQLQAAGTAVTLQQHLRWVGPDGAEQVQEDRRIVFAPSANGAANLMRWHSTLSAVGADRTIGSPATRGRTGAGYGGLFWRFGAAGNARVRVSTEAGVVTGEDAAIGALGRWLVITEDRDGETVSLLLAQPADDLLPWFVRTSGYVGAGPAIAWDAPRTLPQQEPLTMQLWAALCDADLDDASAEVLYRELEGLS